MGRMVPRYVDTIIHLQFHRHSADLVPPEACSILWSTWSSADQWRYIDLGELGLAALLCTLNFQLILNRMISKVIQRWFIHESTWIFFLFGCECGIWSSVELVLTWIQVFTQQCFFKPYFWEFSLSANRCILN